MQTQGDRQEFRWRPNDYSSTTITRYEQEAEHWYRAFKTAESKHKQSDFSGTLDFLNLLITLIVNLMILAMLLLLKFVKFLRS